MMFSIRRVRVAILLSLRFPPPLLAEKHNEGNNNKLTKWKKVNR